MKNRIKLAAAATAGAMALSVTGFAGTAKADTAEDLQIMIDNAPAAVQALIDGLQGVVDTYLETNSTEEAFNELVFAIASTAGTLALGTEQFGQLGFGLLLAGAGVATGLQPILEAIDDPVLLGSLVGADDISTLLANLPGAISAAQPNVVSALASALEGNLTAGTGFNAGQGTPAVVGDVLHGTNTFLAELFADTNLADIRLVVIPPVSLAVIATAGYVQQLEDALEPLFAALAPATDPIVAALEGI